ncbi:MAG TPA: hypothetical protein VF407_06930 [Polyangiaceae bacterium]
MKTIAVTLLVSSVALFSAASAQSATDPSPPQVLEEALAACAKHREGTACEVRISQVDNKGVCVVFTHGDLVCAIDAPP